LVRTACGSTEDVHLSSQLSEQQIETLARISKSKTWVKLNSGLSPDLSIQLLTSLSEMAQQKDKSKSEVTHCLEATVCLIGDS